MKTKTSPPPALVLPTGTHFARRTVAALAVMLLLPLCSLPVRGQDFNAALETSGLSWTNLGWSVTTTGTHDGTDAATAGVAGGPGNSFLDTTLAGPTPLAFWWKLSGGAALDALTFEVDGAAQGPGLSGTTDWQRWEGSLAAGNHELRWRLVRAAGSTAIAYLDEVLVGPPVPVAITVQPLSQSNYFGSAVTLSVTAAGTEPLSYQWRKNGSALYGATGSALAFPSLAHSNVANYDVVVANLYGSVTSAPVAVVILNPYFVTQPANLFGNAGESVTLSATAGGLAPLQYLWRKGGVPIAGATGSSLTLTNVQATDAGNFDVVVTNLYGAATSSVAILAVNTVVADSWNPGSYGAINAPIPCPDDKTILGGFYTPPAGVNRTWLGRVNSDGTLDTTFKPLLNNAVNCVVLQPDGRILVGGVFTTLGGQARSGVGRLNPDGTLDTAFNPNVSGSVYCLVLQPDGMVLLGGSFSTVGGQTRANLARLNSDGTLDTNFTAGANGAVSSVALQPDGSIVAGGIFSQLAGVARSRLGRLSSAGVPDPLFNPGSSGNILALAIQPDGKILVGGSFGQLGGQSRTNLGRLNPDGSVDAGFRADTGGAVQTMALLADGSLVVGGQFRNLAGLPRNYLGRLNSTGAVDPSFAAGTGGTVYSLAALPDGKLFVGGDFSTLAGQPRTSIGRLQSTGPATQDVAFDGTTLTWVRGGTAPEVSQPFAEAWNGSGWTNLGAGIRVGSVWQWHAPQLPLTTTFRLRGQANGGLYNGSSWWVEGFGGFPLVMEPPSTLARNAGESVSLWVHPVGSPPFGYQWLRNGVPVNDGSHASGTTTSNLVLTALGCGDSGAYAVVLTNAYGSVTSQVASLTIRDPFINSQPRSTAVGWGSNATFSVTVVGMPPYAYQWRRSGVAIPGATDPSLTITNVQPADALGYEVMVSGGCGGMTSIVAYLNQELAGSLPYDVVGLASLADGKILIAGRVDTVGGLSRTGIARYNSDGTVDRSFNPHAVPLGYAVLVQPDGHIVVGGAFTNAGGMTRNRLMRLTPGGQVDPGFNPDLDNEVFCLALQADGKILVGGAFTRVGGISRPSLARLNPDGSVDSGFATYVDDSVLTVAVQADGKVLVGGEFEILAGSMRSCIGRLLSTGAIDPGFNPGASGQGFYPNSGQVNAIAVQPNGMILVGGRFSVIGNANRLRIARLYPNGSVDPTFNPGAGGTNSSTWVNALVLQTDGRILVAGKFSTLGGQVRELLGRLNPDGSPDESWNPGAGGSAYATVNSLGIQADGRILAGGYFWILGGVSRRNIGRLDNTDLATSSFAVESNTATWLRGGTGPEVWRTAFAVWNGAGWTNLGAGTRIAGGWQLDGLSLPANATVRAQGFAVGGDDNCSSYIVEEGFGPPVLSIAPVSRTNFLGTTASLSAWVVGSGPVSYRWRKGGVELQDGGNLSGTGTPNLTLANVQPGDQGLYSVVATNALGSVTSAEVSLTVVNLGLTATGPGLGWTTNRQFSFQLSGGAAWPVTVEASTNLNNWLGLTTLWVGPGPAVVTDAATTNYPVRAYRAMPVP